MSTATEATKPIDLGSEEEYEVRNPWVEAFRQLAKNKLSVAGGIVIIFLVVLALSADILQQVGFIEDYNEQHRGSSFAHPWTCATDNDPGDPQWCFMSGADELGRDIFSRVVYGARVSLAVGFIGSIVSMLVGATYGMIAGYYGGRLDNVMMRFVDFMYGLPSLPLIILIQVFFKAMARNAERVGGLGKFLVEIDSSMGGLFFMFIVIGALSWIGIARQARGQVLSLKEKEFVEAAHAIGASNLRIIFVHLLPNILGVLIVIQTMAIPGFIFTESALSFIGLGINPPTPSWGQMINAGRDGIQSRPYLIMVPGFALAITTLAFNFLGDGLRDAFDPRMRE